jgi:hypothetical protein
MELVRNRSFENNTASGTTFNMSNAQATATIADLTAFGTSEEIDLSMAGNHFGDPQDGDWFVSLHTRADFVGGDQDALSLLLESPLTTGADYRLSFYVTGINGDLPGLDVGVSTSSTAFGTQIFATNAYPAAINSWTHHTTIFTATTAATHLTMRSAFPSDSLASVDNFSLTLVPEPAAATLAALAGAAIMARRRSNARR